MNTLQKLGNKYVMSFSLPPKAVLIEELKGFPSRIARNTHLAFFLKTYKIDGQEQPITLPSLEDFKAVAENTEAEIIVGSCGYTLLNQNFRELIKNSIEATATSVTVEFEYDQASDKVHLYFKDNQDAIIVNGKQTTRLQTHILFNGNETVDFKLLQLEKGDVLESTSDYTAEDTLSGNGLGLALFSKSCINRACDFVITSKNEDNERATIHITSPNKPYPTQEAQFATLSLEEKIETSKGKRRLSVGNVAEGMGIEITTLYHTPSATSATIKIISPDVSARPSSIVSTDTSDGSNNSSASAAVSSDSNSSPNSFLTLFSPDSGASGNSPAVEAKEVSDNLVIDTKLGKA